MAIHNASGSDHPVAVAVQIHDDCNIADPIDADRDFAFHLDITDGTDGQVICRLDACCGGCVSRSLAACKGARSAKMRVVGVYDSFFAGDEKEMRSFCDVYIKSFEELLWKPEYRKD